MKVSATLDTSAVTICDIDINGLDAYIAYVDSSNALKITKKSLGLLQPWNGDGTVVPVTIATAATPVS